MDFSYALAGDLERGNFCVKCAANCLAALTIAEDFRPEILITDWHLGDALDGIELAALLKNEHPSLRGILITADSSIAARMRLENAELRESIEKIIFKPASLVTIRNAVIEISNQ